MNTKFKLINGDALEEIKKIPDKTIDLILTDPPYNISQYSKSNIKIGERNLNTKIAEWDTVKLRPESFLNEFKRILSPQGNIFIFTSYNLLGEWHKYFDKEFDTFQFMVWHKNNPVPCVYKKTFLNSCELIICLWNKGHIWNFTTQNEMHNFIQSTICSYPERLKSPRHPTQKPVSILEHIIKIASNENSIVLDPFMGVGSTGVACSRLNRYFIGIEIDKDYYEAAIKRLST